MANQKGKSGEQLPQKSVGQQMANSRPTGFSHMNINMFSSSWYVGEIIAMCTIYLLFDMHSIGGSYHLLKSCNKFDNLLQYTVGTLSVDCWLTAGQLSGNIKPTVWYRRYCSQTLTISARNRRVRPSSNIIFFMSWT